MKILDFNGLKKVQSLLTNIINIHTNNTDNPHNVTKEQLGLENAVCVGGEISEPATLLLRDTDLFAGYPPEFYVERSSISNLNLFTNPNFKINQRDGYIIPIGADFYTDSTLSTGLQVAKKPYKISDIINGYAKFTSPDSGVVYYCSKADIESGYTNETGAVTYTVDRWCTEYYNPDGAILSITPISNGINFKVEKGATYINFLQPIPKSDIDLSGRQIVFSFDTNLISGSYGAYIQVLQDDLSSEVISDVVLTDSGTWHLSAVVPNEYKVLRVGFNCNGMETVNLDIHWAKLEIGSKPTMFIPSNMAEDLTKCLYYTQTCKSICDNCRDLNENSVYYQIKYTPMRVIPTGRFSNDSFNTFGGAYVSDMSGNLQTGFSFTVDIYDNKHGQVIARKNGHGLVKSEGARMELESNYIILDAEVY